MKEKFLHIFDTKEDVVTVDKTKTTVTPLFPKQNTIEIKHDKLEIKASGYEIEGINEILKTIYSSCGVPSTMLSNELDSDSVTNLIDKSKILKGRIAEVNNPDREKPLDIDVDLLKEKIRLPRMAEGFRCPNCGQAFITKAVGANNTQKMFIFRNVNANQEEQKVTFRKVNIEGLKINDRTDKEELVSIYKDLDKLAFEEVNLLYQEGTDCHCPICSNEDYTLKDWIDAWTSPLNYFDSEMICDICGDDARLIMTDKTQYVECEDNCLSKTVVNSLHEDCENCHEEDCNGCPHYNEVGKE